MKWIISFVIFTRVLSFGFLAFLIIAWGVVIVKRHELLTERQRIIDQRWEILADRHRIVTGTRPTKGNDNTWNKEDFKFQEDD